MYKFLDTLNSAQKQAATTTEGPILILAGAGTGKTTTITSRLAFLLSNGILPENTLTLTFTNKAAKEMKERALRLIEQENIRLISTPELFTFHKFGLVILRQYISRLNRSNNFIIVDTDDKKRILKQLIKDENIKPSFIKSQISHFKTNLISPQEALEDALSSQEHNKSIYEKIAKTYALYEEYLLRNNLVDFDDLLKLPFEILANNQDLKEFLSKKYQYLMVDEFQDTNELQMRLIKELCSTHNNICVVGDDDQSIYSWRGANIKNIIDFEKHFKGAKIIKIEENYRSTKNILDLANTLISHNKNRRSKILKATKEEGQKPSFNMFANEREESNFISTKTKELIQKGVNPKEIAVLYRINALSRSIEEEFLAKGIGFNIVDSLRFYERMEVKDALSYLRLVVNSNDDYSLKRIINKPKRGLGKTNIEKIEHQAASLRLSCFEFLKTNALQDFTPKLQKTLKEFVNIITSLQEAKNENIEHFIDLFEQKVRLKEYYSSTKEEERVFNIDELYGAIITWTNDKNLEIDDFLNEIVLTSDQDKITQESVNLMSIHASKGLEFDYVFIIGLEEGFFPMINDDIDPEEERRLGYVAFTRAKKELFLHNVRSRFFRGQRKNMQKSRFLAETGLVSGKLKLDTNTGFKKGDLVKHQLFGMGRILQVSPIGKDYKLIINFGGITKEILSNFVAKI